MRLVSVAVGKGQMVRRPKIESIRRNRGREDTSIDAVVNSDNVAVYFWRHNLDSGNAI